MCVTIDLAGLLCSGRLATSAPSEVEEHPDEVPFPRRIRGVRRDNFVRHRDECGGRSIGGRLVPAAGCASVVREQLRDQHRKRIFRGISVRSRHVASVGGTGYPNDASPATQDALALRLWQQRGWGPWACARIIGLTGSPSAAPAPPAPAAGSLDSSRCPAAAPSVAGWAFDPSSPGTSIQTHVYVNGAGYPFVANEARADVNAEYGITGGHGSSVTVPCSPARTTSAPTRSGSPQATTPHWAAVRCSISCRSAASTPRR